MSQVLLIQCLYSLHPGQSNVIMFGFFYSSFFNAIIPLKLGWFLAKLALSNIFP